MIAEKTKDDNKKYFQVSIYPSIIFSVQKKKSLML